MWRQRRADGRRPPKSLRRSEALPPERRRKGKGHSAPDADSQPLDAASAAAVSERLPIAWGDQPAAITAALGSMRGPPDTTALFIGRGLLRTEPTSLLSGGRLGPVSRRSVGRLQGSCWWDGGTLGRLLVLAKELVRGGRGERMNLRTSTRQRNPIGPQFSARSLPGDPAPRVCQVQCRVRAGLKQESDR